MKRLFTILFIIAGFVAVPFIKVQAQGPLVFDHMQIDIWPEYDQPTALVIYKITLPASASMPAQITLSIPKAAGQPSNVAMQSATDNMLYNLTYTTTTSGDWIKVSFTAPSVTLQVEYYDPGLVKNGTSRSFQYVWPGDYKVNDMVMRIQQPYNATQLNIQPTQGMAAAGSDGLTYYGNDVGPVEQGTSFTYKISYTKPDDTLSVSKITVQAPTAVTSGSPGAGGLLQGLNLGMMVGIVGVVLLGGGVTWFFIQRRAEAEPAERPRHVTPKFPERSSSGATAANGEAIYCHQCGKRAVAGDVFCRGCGARLHP